MDTDPEDLDDAELKDELNSCSHFLVGSELEKGRHCVLIFAISYFNKSFPIEKLYYVFSQLKCGAKIKLALYLCSKT